LLFDEFQLTIAFKMHSERFDEIEKEVRHLLEYFERGALLPVSLQVLPEFYLTSP
jgi:hypothetical protein